MIYTTPISQYNMQNAQQLGQMMQDQEAYTPGINPFASSLTAPAGYSLYQWQQELSLARRQYFWRPVYSAGNLALTSAGTALTFAPVMSQILPESFGATMSSAGKWVGGTSKVAAGIGNIALGIDHAAHLASHTTGKVIGETLGWGIGQGARGALRVGEYTANYMTGGFFTSANRWLGEVTGSTTGKLFNNSLSQYIDQGAASLMRFSDTISGDLAANAATKNFLATAGRGGTSLGSIAEVKKAMGNLGNEIFKAKRAVDAAAGTAEYAQAASKLRELETARANVQRIWDGAVRAGNTARTAAVGSGLTRAGNFANLTSRIGSVGVGLIGSLLNPVFLLKQAVIDRAIDYGVESYENYNSRMEMERELLAKGGRILRFGDAASEVGIDGGFTRAQREHLVRRIDNMAASDYRVRMNDWLGWGASSVFGGHRKYTENLKELKALLSVSADMGMLDMSKSLDEVEKRFDNIVKTVKKLSRITGKSKGELAMALASTQQTEGRFDLNDASASLQKKIYSSYVTGANIQTILQETALGAQMGMQAGIGKAAGADFMLLSRNVFGRMYRNGILDRGDIDMMGGEQGVVSNLASGFMSMTNNNVFRSTLAMLFDTKTGKLNKDRLNAYLNGDRKTSMDFARARNVAMGIESFNKLSQRNEIGGVINEKMPSLLYAMQHGDISQEDMLSIARKEMEISSMVEGTERARAMMLNMLVNEMGPQKGMLMFKALQDSTLLKPDIKEQMAVTRKQLEDRFSLEYERAKSGFGGTIGRWLIGGGGLFAMAGGAIGFFAGGGAPGALAGFAIGQGVGGYIANKFGWDDRYMAWGYNAMSPEMARLNTLGDSGWNIWDYKSALTKYNTMGSDSILARKLGYVATIEEDRKLFQDTSSNYYLKSIDVSNIFKSKGKNRFRIDYAKNYDDMKNKFDEELRTFYEYLVTGDEHSINKFSVSDIETSFILRDVNKKEFFESAARDISIRPEMLGKNSKKDIKAIKDLLKRRTMSVGELDWIEVLGDDIKEVNALTSADNIEKTIEKVAKEKGYSKPGNWYTNVYKGFFLPFGGGAYNSINSATSRIKEKASLQGDAAMSDVVYARFFATEEQLNDYYTKKVTNGKIERFDELKDQNLKDKVKLTVKNLTSDEALDKFLDNENFFSDRFRGTDEEKEYVRFVFGEHVKLAKEQIRRNDQIKRLETSRSYISLFGEKEGNLQELFYKTGDNDFYKNISDKVTAEKARQIEEGKTDKDKDSVAPLDSTTGSSAFNKEMLEVLKGIKTTMDNLTVVMGGSTIPQYNSTNFDWY